MSWLYSRVLVEEYLGENFSDGEPSAPLSGNPIQQAYCAPDKMTAFSRLSRFGMTYKPLMENRGEELLTLFRAGFHAKTYQQPEKAQGLMESDQECGATWRGWLAKYDPDTSLWRTAQCSLLEDLNECLATLPRSGMTRSGLLWELPMLEQIIKGTESGLSLEMWPTPVKSDYAGRRPSKGWQGNSDLPSVVWTRTGGAENPNMSPASINATWTEWLMGWPLGWTDLKPLVTDKSHCVQQPPGDC
jgi:hypothetical protein